MTTCICANLLVAAGMPDAAAAAAVAAASGGGGGGGGGAWEEPLYPAEELRGMCWASRRMRVGLWSCVVSVAIP